jgi:NADPH:quinone reductase-like Zn-dependent oxidoreductase
MKAIECTRYGPPEVLRLTEREKPAPGNKEVLIRMRATAVTASDCIVRGFKLPRQSFIGVMMGMVLGFKRPRRKVLGMIISGEIEDCGKQVSRFKPGDAVYGWTLKDALTMRFGTYAEYIAVPQNSVLVQKPDQLSFEEAAAIPYGALIAWYFLKKGHIDKVKHLLVYGASGAIGTAAVQLAKSFGCRVTGVCSTRNLDLVASLGADSVVDYTREDPEKLGESFDLILDAVGTNKDSGFKQKVRGSLAPGGKYISVDVGSPNAGIEDLELINRLVMEDRFRAVIDRSYPLEEMIEAHRYVDKGHKRGNVIIAV